MKKILLLPALLILGILLFGCAGQGTTPGQQNSTPGQQNSTQAGALAAQYGNNVTVDYTLRVDGQVWDTSLADVARNAGIYSVNVSYQPITFPLLTGQGLLSGFVTNIVGMKVGQSKNFSLAPADGYGPINQSKIFNVSRNFNVSRFQSVPMGYFVQNNITVMAGKALPSQVGNVSIYNFTNDTVTVMYSMNIGQKFVQSGLPAEVVNFSNDTLFIRFDTIANKTYSTTNPASGAVTRMKVTYEDNETVVLDENSPLAGKTLDFEVILKSLTR